MATLAEIRTRIRQRTDTVNSACVTDAGSDQLVTAAGRGLYGLLVLGPLHGAWPVEAGTADDSAPYALPADFLGVIGVFRDAGEVKYPLKRFPDKFRPGNRQGIAHYY